MKKLFSIFILLLFLFPVAAHAEEDINSLLVPGISLYFSNAETGSQNVNTDKTTTIKARAVYENCLEGKSYVLVLRFQDSASGELCKFPWGEDSLKQAFTAEGKVGFFEFEFVLDACSYPGSTLTESHYIEGLETGFTHIGNNTPAKLYVPRFETNAISESGEKTISAKKASVICDIISYSGFAPGEQYRIVTGIKDGSTGKLIRGKNGSPVTSTSRFTPTAENGQIATKITADLCEYGSKNIVVFEKIYITGKSGDSQLLLSGEYDAEDNRTVLAGLTQLAVLDEMYKTPIPGVEIQISSVAGDEAYEGVSDSEGRCLFPIDAYTEYSCRILSAPEEYQKPSGLISFIPAESESEVALNVFLLKKNTIVINRTDAETGAPVAGIITEVRDSDGRLLSTIYSTEDGTEYLDADSFWRAESVNAKLSGKSSFMLNLYFSDVSTPSQYYPKEKNWVFSIDEDGNVMGLSEIKSVKRTPVTISVVDMKEAGIAGLEFSLVDQDGKLQGRAVTDHEGKIFFTARKTGTYILVEEGASLGYVLSLGKKQFTIEDDGTINGNLTIIKLSDDFTGNVLTVILITGLFVLCCLLASHFFNRKIQSRFQPSVPLLSDGRHSK